MVAGNISSEKIDLLIYGPSKPIVDNGFSDQFVLHSFETNHDLDRLTPAVAGKIRGAAVTYNSVRGDGTTLARFPKLEIVSSFGVGYDHIDANYAREHNIIVTNTPDVLTEEVADTALAFIKRYVPRTAVSTSFGATGFTRCASNPVSRTRRRSSAWPWPVKATSRTRWPKAARRRRASS